MCSNFAESSNLENENQEKRLPEELFADIMKSLEEYTNENAETVLSKKSKILSILKTHRPIKIGNYFYGLSLNLRKNWRMIVFEWDDRAKIREYTQTKNTNIWACRECFRLHGCKHTRQSYTPGSCTYLYLVNGIAFIQTNHDCVPRDYNLVMQYQKFLEKGDTGKARRMARTISFAYGQSSFTNVVNVTDDVSTSLPKRSNYSEKENAYGDKKIVTETSVSLKSNDKSRILSTKNNPMNKRKRNNSDAEEIGHSGNKICETAAKKQKIEEANDPVKTYSFEMPSTSELKKICEKLGVKYSKEAKGFWNEIKFQNIVLSSKNIKTPIYKTKNFYKILSNFLTGRFSNYEQIYYSINCAFRDKLVSDGEMPFEEIDLLCSSYTVTEKHLKFIAKYFPCRVLIFNRDEDEIKKFGKWKKNNILTFVLSFSNRKYSVIVNL